MIIVDTHAHASPYWSEPVEVLLFQMNRNGVDKTVLTAMNGQTEEKYNRYIIECTRRFPGRFSPVVVVDTERTDAPTILKYWAKEGAEGARLKVYNRSPGKDPLAIWKTCAELGLPVTCQGHKKEEFAEGEFRKLIKALPDVNIILEHQGKPDEASPYPIYKKVLSLSRFPNVYIKVGGLGEICRRPFPFHDPFYAVEGVPPYIKMVYEAFGPARMMWGSNYPPSGHLEGYRNTIRYLDEHLDGFCSKEDKQWIFGKTALTLFKFKQQERA
jgi:L-fuconolactonase